MKFSVTIPLFLIIANVQAQLTFKPHIYINERGDSLLYQLLTPPVERQEKYPLVVFLHGAGERGSDNQKQLTHGSLLFLNEANQQKFPAFVVFPQCQQQDYWGSVSVNRTTRPYTLHFDYNRPITQSLAMVMQLIDSLKQSGYVDESRIYLAGLSMGGMGTFEAVYKFPQVFAAAVAICGGGDVNAYSMSIPTIPIRVFHGAADDIVDVENSRKIMNVLRAKNKNVSYTEYPEVKHNSWDNAFRETDFLSWLFSHQR